MLKIRNVSPKDFGSYKCVAQNSLGGTDGDIKLDGKTVDLVTVINVSRARVRIPEIAQRSKTLATKMYLPEFFERKRRASHIEKYRANVT